MSRNKEFYRLTKFLQLPKLVEGILEVSLRLQTFWWVAYEKIVSTRNGLALTYFLAKFRAVRKGPRIYKRKQGTNSPLNVRIIRVKVSSLMRS